ncbi:MAG: chromate transporter, partial [Pseudomonadota bacterium]
RTVGGLIAGILFVLPGAIAILVLSIIYALYGDVGFVEALFFGLKAAVLAIVLQAVIKIGKRALRNSVMIAIAAASFVGIFAFNVPFPVIVLGAALIGFIGARAGIQAFAPGGGHAASDGVFIADADTVLGEHIPAHARRSGGRLMATTAGLLVLWLAPIALLLGLLGPDNVFTNIAVFFSQMAVVTFGGAYAVLAYVAQAAVETYGWMAPGEMLDGLGMAETTPGPLIMVTQFVGFLGAFRDPGTLSPLMAGILGGALTTWVTFVPCFIWIFLGGPHIERLRDNKALSAALGAITAAVVGVILNLAVWFALHVVFGTVNSLNAYGFSLAVPDLSTMKIAAAALVIAAIIALFRFKVGVLTLLGATSLAGIALHFAGLTG